MINPLTANGDFGLDPGLRLKKLLFGERGRTTDQQTWKLEIRTAHGAMDGHHGKLSCFSQQQRGSHALVSLVATCNKQSHGEKCASEEAVERIPPKDGSWQCPPKDGDDPFHDGWHHRWLV